MNIGRIVYADDISIIKIIEKDNQEHNDANRETKLLRCPLYFDWIYNDCSASGKLHGLSLSGI